MKNIKVSCELTSCKYNSSCCACPGEKVESLCNKDLITLRIDETGALECSEYIDDYNKQVECTLCQISKYNGIRLVDEKEFYFED